MTIEILGYIATFLINIAYVPQLYRTIKTKKVEGLSFLMFVILIISGILWTIYGFLINNLPLIICNSINTIQSLIILYYKIKYNDTTRTS